MDGRTDGRGDGRGMDRFLLAVVISSDISILSELGVLQGFSWYVFFFLFALPKDTKMAPRFLNYQ